MIATAEIPEIRFDGKTYRLPFAHLLRPLTPAEFAGLDASIAKRRVLERITTYDSRTFGQRCVINGASRLRIAADRGLSAIPTCHRGEICDEEAHEQALELNTVGRHLSPSEIAELRQKRNAEIVEARDEGHESLRTIAARFHLSEKMIRKILEEAGADRSAPETITGADGKTYSARRTENAAGRVLSSEGRTDNAADCVLISDEQAEDAAVFVLSSEAASRTPEYYLDRTRRALASLIKPDTGPLTSLLHSPLAARLQIIASRYEVPLDGDNWPALSAVVAALSDLAASSSVQ
jgi:hypothetical protein